MTSSQAAEWLIKTYPIDSPSCGEAIRLISHRPWKRVDQTRLARYYLKKIPFADSRAYEVFASFMSFKLFVKVIQEQFPVDKSDIDLLLYYLLPVLGKTAKTDSDRELMKSLIMNVSPRRSG